jgi:dihydrofolate reductase
MRKVVVSEFLALDGVMEAPHEWSLAYWSDDIGTFKNDELFASDALLLGRVTYEGFAAAWPPRADREGVPGTEPSPFADRINSMPKYVVSTTMKNADWDNSTIISENVVEEISRLKQQDGMNILVAGSADLVDTLLQNDLVDELQLLVYPIVPGKGKHLFRDGSPTNLKLIESRTFSTGVVLLSYAPDKVEAK